MHLELAPPCYCGIRAAPDAAGCGALAVAAADAALAPTETGIAAAALLAADAAGAVTAARSSTLPPAWLEC